MLYLKYIAKITVRFLLHVFWIFPVNKRNIFFLSFNGKQYSCNPKYLYLYLQKKYGDKYRYIWGFANTKNKNLLQNTVAVKTHSIRYLFLLLTSKVVIENTGTMGYIPFRKEQTVLNTWHGGGAYKKVGTDFFKEKVIQTVIVLSSQQIHFYISSCRKFSDIQSQAEGTALKTFITTGMPRNDIFFKDYSFIKESVRSHYHIAENTKVVLYAPTYRGIPRKSKDMFAGNYETIDCKRLLNTLNETTGDTWIIFYRGHHASEPLQHCGIFDSAIDVTSYPDMQELLCCADMLITDYSSSMWDFALTHKPGFLYVPDLDEYNNERGFYTPIDSWPYPYAKTMNSLCQEIKNYDRDSAVKKIDAHLAALGSYEDGHACERVCDILFGNKKAAFTNQA